MKNWEYVLFSLVVFSRLVITADGKKLEVKINKFKWTPKVLEPIKVGHAHQMTLFPFHKRRVKTLSVHPPIFEIKNFLSDVECDHLISYAKRLGLEKSPLISAKDTMDEETSERTFKIWDNNDDGFIEPVEIMHVRGKEDLFFTEKDIFEMFEELQMDGDGNGKIDYEEFTAVTVPVIIEYFDKLRRTRPRLRSRNSKQAWMFHNDPEYPILSDFHGRLARLTLLPEEIIRNSEPLQVVKYDMHGHYHCHLDSDEINSTLPCCTFTNEENCRLCRFVSVMFYLNEPEEGGETAFPLANNETYSEEAWTRSEGWKCNLAQNCYESNLIVKPEKGKAVMWYNHFLDKKTGWLGDLDPLTHHGGCDVIMGTKWIANAWLALVGDLGTGDAFKGWIDHGKDESVFEPGTNWKGEAIKKGAKQNNQEACKDEEKGNEGAMKDQESETNGKEKEMKQEQWKGEEKFSKEEEKVYLTRKVKEQKDGSYDVKLEL